VPPNWGLVKVPESSNTPVADAPGSPAPSRCESLVLDVARLEFDADDRGDRDVLAFEVDAAAAQMHAPQQPVLGVANGPHRAEIGIGEDHVVARFARLQRQRLRFLRLFVNANDAVRERPRDCPAPEHLFADGQARADSLGAGDLAIERGIERVNGRRIGGVADLHFHHDGRGGTRLHLLLAFALSHDLQAALLDGERFDLQLPDCQLAAEGDSLLRRNLALDGNPEQAGFLALGRSVFAEVIRDVREWVPGRDARFQEKPIHSESGYDQGVGDENEEADFEECVGTRRRFAARFGFLARFGFFLVFGENRLVNGGGNGNRNQRGGRLRGNFIHAGPGIRRGRSWNGHGRHDWRWNGRRGYRQRRRRDSRERAVHF